MHSTQPMRQARLDRVAFRTSRASDFVGRHELTAQIGHGPQDWPLVVLKELVDNALDELKRPALRPGSPSPC